MKKIKNDILYSKISKLSEEELLKAGWFETKLSNKQTKEHYMLNMFGHDLSLFTNTPNEIVLFSTGSYAPIHDGHIFSWLSSIEEAVKNNLIPKLFLISPSHDDYVSTKSKTHKKYNIHQRIDIIYEKLTIFFEKHPQYIKYKNLFKIDIFESLHSSVAINFSEVLQYIQISLNKNNLNNVKIGYVFGSDNYDFIKPFVNSNYYAFCIIRDNFFSCKKYKNIFLVENINKETIAISSTLIRKNYKLKNSETLNNQKGFQYFIRNDTLFAIEHWIKKYPQYQIKLEHEYHIFHFKLFNLIHHIFPNLSIISTSLKNHQKIINDINIKNNIINVDICTNQEQLTNQIPLNICRIFELASLQKNVIKLDYRNNIIDNNIKPNQNYIFIDDDISSGKTLNQAREILNKYNSKIINTISLTEEEFKISNVKYNCFDVIDTRDFLLGTNFGGLVCNIQGTQKRVPYWQPFVNLKYRAKMNQIKYFQLKLLDLNINFFKNCKFIKPEDLSVNINDLSFIEHKNILNFLNFMKTWTSSNVID